tara:strand:- start:1367 stop:1972 length:606 start_codon:yes stop_codon:yes gene_type:complete
MSLKYFVHVSSISNLSDARYCSGMMVDSLGFNLDENSTNKLEIESVKEISQWINGVKLVAEFNNSSEKYINKILEKEEFDAIQINYENNSKNINFDRNKVLVRISNPKMIKKESNDYLKKNFPEVEILIIDNLSSKNINYLELINEKYMILINPYEDINLISNTLKNKNFGLLLKGSDEIRPGLKDYDALSDLLESIDESF